MVDLRNEQVREADRMEQSKAVPSLLNVEPRHPIAFCNSSGDENQSYEVLFMPFFLLASNFKR